MHSLEVITYMTSSYFNCRPGVEELQFCIQDFDFLWSSILKPLFQPLVTGPTESGWGHMSTESAFTSYLLLHRLLSAQSSSFLHCEVHHCCALWMGLPLNHFMYFVLPKSVCVILKINFHALYAFWVYFSVGPDYLRSCSYLGSCSCWLARAFHIAAQLLTRLGLERIW